MYAIYSATIADRNLDPEHTKNKTVRSPMDDLLQKDGATIMQSRLFYRRGRFATVSTREPDFQHSKRCRIKEDHRSDDLAPSEINFPLSSVLSYSDDSICSAVSEVSIEVSCQLQKSSNRIPDIHGRYEKDLHDILFIPSEDDLVALNGSWDNARRISRFLSSVHKKKRGRILQLSDDIDLLQMSRHTRSEHQPLSGIKSCGPFTRQEQHEQQHEQRKRKEQQDQPQEGEEQQQQQRQQQRHQQRQQPHQQQPPQFLPFSTRIEI
mmetsp:Transcript_23913/g.50868  ORF Transcript_23913/g.50868 Transcript_23913/m.50868 type:complete len:265 (-) Transcript_23913:310-1104(-)